MKHNLTRRGLLRTTAIGSLAISGVAGFGLFDSREITSFANSHTVTRKRLKIPALDEGIMIDGVRNYNLTMQNGETEFFDGYQTDTSGVNGSYLGPTLKLRAGENVRLNVTNQIGEDTTLHWHGFHLPASQDGGPHQMIAPDETRASEFKVKQKAATLWYHPHLMGKTAEHVWRGMAGIAIIEDDESDNLNLPREYGVDDVPLVLQDRIFTSGAKMGYTPSMHSIMVGYVGDIPLVNGTPVPFFEARTSKLRLRILNGSNGSFYNLGLSNNRSFTQIASDGGLLREPVEIERLILSPGERAEFIVDIKAGEPFFLRNYSLSSGSQQNTGGGMASMMSTDQGEFDFLELRPAGNIEITGEIPEKLAEINRLNESDAVKTRKFTFQMQMGPRVMLGLVDSHLINGKAMKMSRIDETVKMGDTEIWELRNASPMPHPIHIHDVQFQILDRNGVKPAPGEAGRKDTVLVNPNEVVRVIMKFEDYSDPNSPYMYHCHILEHEDAGMMGQFVVV